MSGQLIELGPFSGGLNTFSDISAIANNELSVCENMEVDFDGSLVSRPPYVYRGINMPLNTAGGQISLLGYFNAGGPSGTVYLLGSDGYSSTYYYNGTAWVLITSTFAATAMAQFDDKAWLVAPTTGTPTGGYWTPAGGFVADANMPQGDSIVIWKATIWIARGKDATTSANSIYYSNPVTTTTRWPSTKQYIDINKGDGQGVVYITTYYSSLLIFKRDSIWAYQFDSNPALGTTAKVVPNIGLDHKKSIAVWESYIYFTYDDRAFEFINNRASQINLRVPFVTETKTGINADQAKAVSLFNNRILFSFWDRQYVFNMRTRTWSVWKSPTLGPIGEVMISTNHNGLEDAVVVSSATVATGGTRSAKTLYITDGVTTESEVFQCVVETKNYNYDASSVYKRLFWWGADALFKGQVVASAIPVTFSKIVYWNQISSLTWETLANYTWGQPTSPSNDLVTTVETGGTSAIRKFVKFLKSMRFRQVRYRIVFNTDGSTSTAPVRLFSISTYVRAHQHVSKEIT